MPRKNRLDAPGALHHIIARGNGRQKIFVDDRDRDDFVERMGRIIEETRTECYAWALIPNHFHLLLRTGATPVSTVMSRLLTGHAATFNRRHNRNGHLFQNRYKSILCDREPYLLELVRYIHLNPLRAGLVQDIEALDRFPYSGHSGIMTDALHTWQTTRPVLVRFGETGLRARHQYRAFIEAGIEQGRRPELVGGGLIRSMGGWEAVKRMRHGQVLMKGDERILGDGDFVERVLAEAEALHDERIHLRGQSVNLDRLAEYVAGLFDASMDQVWSAGKQRSSAAARGVLCYWAVRKLGISMTSMARRYQLSVAAISKAVARGENLCKANGWELEL